MPGFSDKLNKALSGLGSMASNSAQAVRKTVAPTGQESIHKHFTALINALDQRMWDSQDNSERQHLEQIIDKVESALHDLFGDGAVDKYGDTGAPRMPRPKNNLRRQ